MCAAIDIVSSAASVEFYQKLGFTVERRQDNLGWAKSLELELPVLLRDGKNLLNVRPCLQPDEEN